MKLEVLDTLSLPGEPGKANEDAFGHDGVAAVVIDGATPLGDSLMPGPSDAAWIAQFGARRLMAHLKDGDGARKARPLCSSHQPRGFRLQQERS